MPVSTVRIGPAVLGSLVAGLVAFAGVESAEARPPIITFDIAVNGGTGGPFTDQFNQVGAATGNPQIWHFANAPGGYTGPNGEWKIESWNFTADDDPTGSGAALGARLGAGFTVKNYLADGPTAGDNHLFFSIMITMPLTAATTPSQWMGSGGMTLNMGNSENDFAAALYGTNDSIWNYRVNGADVASLYDPPYVLGGTDGPNTASDSAVLSPGQTGSLVGLTPNSLGIRLDFWLTPGETATFNGNFLFIPGPGAIALLAVAGLTGRSRRRS